MDDHVEEAADEQSEHGAQGDQRRGLGNPGEITHRFWIPSTDHGAELECSQHGVPQCDIVTEHQQHTITPVYTEGA